MRRLLAGGVMLGVLLVWSGMALAGAAPSPVDTTAAAAKPNFMIDILGLLKGSLQDTGALKAAGYSILFPLMMIEAHRQGISILMGGKETQDVVWSVVRLMIVGAIFAGFIQYSDILLKGILHAFNLLGMKVAHIDQYNTVYLLELGVDSASNVVNSVGVIDALEHPIITLSILFAAICIMLAFVIAGIQLLMAQVEATVVVAVAPMVFGFGGLKYTRDMASKPFNHVLSVGMKLITIAILSVVLSKFGEELSSYLRNITHLETDMKTVFELAATGIFLIFLSFMVPSLASSMISGVASLAASQAMAAGASAVGAGAQLASGAVTAGAAAASGGAALASKGAASLGGVMQAARAGMDAASDLGKTGMDAAMHAGGQMASHGASVLGGKARDMASGAAAKMGGDPSSTFGGQVAQSIQSARGGEMAPAGGGTPGAGGGASGAGATPAASQGGANSAGMPPSSSGGPASSSGGNNSTQPGGSIGGDASMPGPQQDLGYTPAAYGDAAGAGLTSPGADPNAAQGQGQDQPSLLDKVKGGLKSVSDGTTAFQQGTQGFHDQAQVAAQIDTRGD